MSKCRIARLAVILSVFSASPSLTLAQSAPTAEPTLAFEVASVRRNTSGEGAFGPARFQGASVQARNVPLEVLIWQAYRIPATELVGGPGWIRETSGERYDIDARAAEGSSRQEQEAMLQHLLESRFGLRLRREVRDMPVYVLTRLEDGERLGPNLRRAAKQCAPRGMCEGRTGAGFATYAGAQWPLVVQSVASPLDLRLIDRTGLSGAFDFELTYSRGLSVNVGDNGVDIFTAVRQQLGLKLERALVPTEVLVVESVSRPTPN